MKQENKSVKVKTKDGAPATEAQPRPQSPTREQIQRRAYEISQTRGGASGHALDDWLLAEVELKAEMGLSQVNPVRPERRSSPQD